MNKDLTNYCTSCGNKVEDFSEKCFNCGKNPVGRLNDLLTEEESGMTNEEQKFLTSKFCINCGNSNKGLKGEYSELICPNCGKNPCGMGKEFRDEISINFCENCGNKVKDRDEVCSCGRLPYQVDNELHYPSNTGIEDFTEEDWDKHHEVSKVRYCKDCGFYHNDDSKYYEVNNETGGVDFNCPNCS